MLSEENMRGFFMYFYFAECKEDSITIIREASKEEANHIHALNKPISDMIIDKDRINAFNRAYNQLFEEIRSNNISRRDSAEVIQQKFSQLLFEFRKFCDNWETRLVHEFGKESDEYKLHKSATAFEYDNYMEYRIMYQLRNYDQHCGAIFSKVSTSLCEDGTVITTPFASREYLLENFTKWKAEEIVFLQNQEEYIDFLPYVGVLHGCIERIHEKTMQIHFNKNFFRSCAELICIANEFVNEEFVSLISTEHPLPEELEGDKHVNITTLFVPICKELLKAHIIGERQIVRILYWGDKYQDRFEGIASKILEADIVTKLSNSQFINLQGQEMIRTNMQLQIDTGDCYFVLVDRKIGFSKINEICESYKLYLKALLKNE